MTEDALRQDLAARYESAEQLDSHMKPSGAPGQYGDGIPESRALDNSLFDKAQVFDEYFSHVEPDNNAIAIAVSLDDYGNLPNLEYYPKVGDDHRYLCGRCEIYRQCTENSAPKIHRRYFQAR